MQLNNVNLVYTIIYEEITGSKGVSPSAAQLWLDEYFKKGREHDKKRKMKVVLVDELDSLITKKQELLYHLFDWPSYANSNLLIVAIANTMDLPERLLGKVSSRIGTNRIVYEPYTKEQIEEIISQRLEGVDIFKRDSVRLSAAKVSKISGDIRRGLQICKRAVELCRAEHMESGRAELTAVQIQHINKAYNELHDGKNVQVMRTLRKYEIMVLVALTLEARGSEKVLVE